MSAPEEEAEHGPPEPRSRLLARVAALARRHPRLVVGSAVAAMLFALVIVALRPAAYVADAKLLVGTFEVPSEAVPGYVLASQSLAASYERLPETDLVEKQVSEQLGIEPAEVRRQISVTAIPNSAILLVQATSTDAEKARRMADAMAEGIDAAVEELAVRGDSGEALAQFEEATRELVAAQLVETEARATFDAAPSSSNQQNLNDASLAVATAELTAQSRADEYLQTQKRPSSSSDVRTLGGSIVTQSSRLVATLAALILAAVVGAAVGLLLAWRKERHGAAPDRAAAQTDDAEGTEDTEDTADTESSSHSGPAPKPSSATRRT